MHLLNLRGGLIRATILLAVALAFALLVLKIHSFPVPSLPCGFKSVTGLPCVFCGGTRSACALLEGDFAHALYLNPISIATLSLGFIAAIICVAEILLGHALADWPRVWKSTRKIAPIILLFIAFYWVAHVHSALQKPKLELLDLNKPIAAGFRGWMEPQKP
jgi:hypothetical protein